MLDQFSLEGRRALVTGGSKGLGHAMALALARAGADIALASRSVEVIKAAADGLALQTGRRCVGIAADVTDGEQVEAMVRQAVEALGGLDILINSAGINIRRPAVDQPEADFRRIIETNVTGTFLTCRSAARHMIANRRGSIINLGSMLSLVGLPDRAAYTSSKGAVVQMTRTLALEWAPAGIRVNALCPGPIVTEINMPVLNDPAARQYFIDRIPLGRWGRPDEVGGAAVFLASDASSFMTGASLVIDGGWTVQ